MVISSFISSLLVLALGIWAYLKLESSMNIVAEKQLIIEPSRFSYKMWKDMPVTMYQSFTFFNLTNWHQVKSIGQKPKFVEVGPYVYRTIWTKSDINFMEEEKLVSFSERKQWIFQSHLSRGNEDDQIWTINTPLMTALALIQNAPVITRNIVSVILDGLGEGAFIKRNIRSLLFEGYSDLIVSVGPLFDRRFSNFNGKFAYLYNKNDSIDGTWTVSTGADEMSNLNKIHRFQSNIVNMTSFSSGLAPQGLNEVKPECARAWSLDQSTNGQLFPPFNKDTEQQKLLQHQQQQQSNHQQHQRQTGSARTRADPMASSASTAPKRFFSRSATSHDHSQQYQQQQDLVPNPFLTGVGKNGGGAEERPAQLKDFGKFIFYPDLCRPIHLLPSRHQVATANGIQASRYYIDPRVFMNSTQVPSNKCYEMNPRPPLANALAATINSVTGANVAMPNLVTGASSPFAMFSPPSHHHQHHNNHHHHGGGGGQYNNAGGANGDSQANGGTGNQHGIGGGSLANNVFERANNPASFLNNALHSLGAGVGAGLQNAVGGAGAGKDQQASSSNNAPISRLGRVRQLFNNIVSQRMSGSGPGGLLPSLAAVPAGLLMGNHFSSSQARNSPDDPTSVSTMAGAGQNGNHRRQQMATSGSYLNDPSRFLANNNPSNLDTLQLGSSNPMPIQSPPAAPVGGGGGGASDRWITQFRFKWPRGVFSIGQCQLGAPIYASLPHFLDADEFYLEQVDGLKPNRSLHEFYIDVESTLHSVPVGAKARLQLNVATPELRFRNIPNAMIPVLWQEVTFEIDKPVAAMLYWSFTMLPTICKLISLLLLGLGCFLIAIACFSGLKQRKAEAAASSGEGASDQVGHLSTGTTLSSVENSSRHSTWYSMQAGGDSVKTASAGQQQANATTKQRSANSIAENNNNSNSNNNDGGLTCDELRQGAALNYGFVACPATETKGDHLVVHGGGGKRFCCANLASNLTTASSPKGSANKTTRKSNNGKKGSVGRIRSRSGSSVRSSSSKSSNCDFASASISTENTNETEVSPKQPSSRASSQCELVVSGASLTTRQTVVSCPGCLLACLHHPNRTHNSHHHQSRENSSNNNGCLQHQQQQLSACDKSIVRLQQQQQITTTNISDIDDRQVSFLSTSTLSSPSSRESNLDSCSAIYTTTMLPAETATTQQQQQPQPRQSRTGTFK